MAKCIQLILLFISTFVMCVITFCCRVLWHKIQQDKSKVRTSVWCLSHAEKQWGRVTARDVCFECHHLKMEFECFAVVCFLGLTVTHSVEVLLIQLWPSRLHLPVTWCHTVLVSSLWHLHPLSVLSIVFCRPVLHCSVLFLPVVLRSLKS